MIYLIHRGLYILKILTFLDSFIKFHYNNFHPKWEKSLGIFMNCTQQRLWRFTWLSLHLLKKIFVYQLLIFYSYFKLVSDDISNVYLFLPMVMLASSIFYKYFLSLTLSVDISYISSVQQTAEDSNQNILCTLPKCIPTHIVIDKKSSNDICPSSVCVIVIGNLHII